MSYELERHLYKNYIIKIVSDDDPVNPRTDYDNFSTMVCWHTRYSLGDKHNYRDPGDFLRDITGEETADRIERKYERLTAPLHDLETGPNERERRLRDLTEKYREDARIAAERNVLLLPLFLYDHSGITISTTPFSCPWDSGQVGWVYVTKDQIRKEFNTTRVTKTIRQKALALIKAEVEVYDQYLSGDVWGFIIEHPDDGEIDSCWGFYGSDYCLEEARAMVDAEDWARHPLLEQVIERTGL